MHKTAYPADFGKMASSPLLSTLRYKSATSRLLPGFVLPWEGRELLKRQSKHQLYMCDNRMAEQHETHILSSGF